MEKEEVLAKASGKKALVGEMERSKMFKVYNISLLVAGVLALAFIITEFALGHKTGGFALGAVCYIWACVQYLCQYLVARRPWQVLIGTVLHGLAGVACVVFYILFSVGVL